MTPAARLQASIELLDSILSSLREQGSSADVLIQQYFRSRRYAGSKDRAAVREIVYDVIRKLGRYNRQLSTLSVTPKQDEESRLMAAMYLNDAGHPVEQFFVGDKFAPAPLSNREQDMLREVAKAGDTPESFISEDYVPGWMLPALQQRFEANLQQEVMALNGRAPLDLRINGLKSCVSNSQQYIENKEINSSFVTYTDFGLRLPAGTSIKGWGLYQDGSLEIQDAAAQIAVKCCGLQSGQNVIDLCAGAGGKSLAAASYMSNKGKITACDINAARLDAAKPRIKRAGASIIRLKTLSEYATHRQNTLREQQGTADRVILDVPCTGTGVWRRNPESKWRLAAPQLKGYQKLQYQLLREGAGLVKEGGRLIYMTCSLLPQENEDQIKAFLQDNPGFKLVPYSYSFGGSSPKTASLIPECLQLTPFQHNTDGFFVAIMQKDTL